MSVNRSNHFYFFILILNSSFFLSQPFLIFTAFPPITLPSNSRQNIDAQKCSAGIDYTCYSVSLIAYKHSPFYKILLDPITSQLIKRANLVTTDIEIDFVENIYRMTKLPESKYIESTLENVEIVIHFPILKIM